MLIESHSLLMSRILQYLKFNFRTITNIEFSNIISLEIQIDGKLMKTVKKRKL